MAMQSSFHIVRPALKTDDDRGTVLAGIVQVAPNSALYKGNQVIQTTYALLGTAFAAIKPASDLVASDEAKLVLDRESLVSARSTFDGTLETYYVLLEKNAKTAADLTAAGATERPARVQSTLTELPVPIVDIRIAKHGHGYFYATAQETGKPRNHYVAEWSPDPITPTSWVELVGNFKRRKVTGASGTRVWVRFAMVRGALKSDWSTPVLVTIP